MLGYHLSTARYKKIFSAAQYGFRSKRSCVLQLLEVFDYWTDALDKGIPVDVVYFDFRKAFDSVPHKRMLKKIEAYGITGKLLVSGFLTNRLQRVVIGETFSDWMEYTEWYTAG